MSESICKFMPAKNQAGNLTVCSFVYETEFQTLSQPFFRPIHYLHLITAGQGVLKMNGKTYPLSPGSIFFAFPAIPYEIQADEQFRFLYISFMGNGVNPLLEELGIKTDEPVYTGFGHLLEFWLSAIVRVQPQNANILVESVLLHTLSFINTPFEEADHKGRPEDLFDMIVDYIDAHYCDADISLKKLAAVFSYTEKYLSHLFKQKMGVGFSQYVNQLRLRYAHGLLDQRIYSVAEVAAQCGYSDAFYFSKVFKKAVGIPPNEYRKKHP